MGNSYSTDTCSEIIEILDHIPRVLYDKLPSSIINYFYQNADVRNKQFEYNVALPILEQDVSQDAKNILMFLFNVFWKKDIETIKHKCS